MERLPNKFLITSNGDPKFEANIVDGNQRVVAARLYDAKFFCDEDLKRPLEDYVERLDTVVFQEKLGTTRAKTDRIVTLAKAIAADAGVTGQEAADAERAAYLAKADLVTGAVVEFTSVQGIMGSYYAKAAGETDAVARAIADHYRPRFSGDDAAGQRGWQHRRRRRQARHHLRPSSPYARPRPATVPTRSRCAVAALGIVNYARFARASPVSLGAARSRRGACDAYAARVSSSTAPPFSADVADFFVARTKVMLRDGGESPDVIDVVLDPGVTEPVVFIARVAAL